MKHAKIGDTIQTVDSLHCYPGSALLREGDSIRLVATVETDESREVANELIAAGRWEVVEQETK